MDSQTSTVANWETSKENIQPLRSGRNVGYLKTALQPSLSSSKNLHDEKQRFEEEILASEQSNDPLDPWHRYLNWIQQNFPIGENNRTYEEMLTKYLKKFLPVNCYRNDLRYINAWLTMAKINENPQNVFSYMKSENIGLSCAVFYVSWADEYEKYGNWKKAAAVYKLAEKNYAEPVDVLQKMKRAFEMRIARKVVQEVELEPSADSSTSTTSANLERKVFQNISCKSSSQNPKPYSYQKIGQQTIRGPQSNKLNIFCDDENTSVINDAGKWGEVPSSAMLNKENSLSEQKWKGAKLRQKNNQTSVAIAPVSTSTFVVFREENVLTAPPSARKVLPNVERVLADQKKDTLKPLSFKQTLMEISEEKDKNVVCMYPADKIYSVMGEFQQEEILAALWRKNTSKLRDHKQNVDNSSAENMYIDEECLVDPAN